MRVKVHPHKTMVNAGVEACVSVTPDRKHGRAYYMGTVNLTDISFRIHESGVTRAQTEKVRNVHAWAVGDLIHEASAQNPLSASIRHKAQFIKVTYHYDSGRFMAIDGTDVTDGHFRAAVFCGRDLHITKEW